MEKFTIANTYEELKIAEQIYTKPSPHLNNK